MTASRHIIHVDMDAFYASVEQRDFPEYRGKPVIVGADPKGGKGRGVVSAASYEARKFGVHSAQPISQAFKCCPRGIFVRGRMDRYAEISERIMTLFLEFTPLVEPLSLDEAFLDVTGTERLWGDSSKIGRAIKQKIRDQESLTASVGIGPNKLVAKIASEYGKPDGFVHVLPQNVQSFLDLLPVGRLWGVGKKTQQLFREMGVETVGDLRRLSERTLRDRFGLMGEALRRHALGVDDSPVLPEREAKSVSNEHTFEIDTDDIQKIRHTLQALSERVGYRLRSQGLSGRTITLKIRFESFETFTRHVTHSSPICDGNMIFESALSLLDQFDLAGRKVRLLGVGVTQLVSGGATQAELFPDATEKKGKMTEALDALRDRFGHFVIGNAETFRRRKDAN
jgi:DNA polymerase-4